MRQTTRKRKVIFSGSPSKIPVLTNSAATATRMCTPQCRQSGCPRHTIHERMVGGPAKFGRIAHRSLRVATLDLRNGCPSGSIRHPGKHLFPQWLREAGYYCTNNSKDTPTNSTTDNKAAGTNATREALTTARSVVKTSLSLPYTIR